MPVQSSRPQAAAAHTSAAPEEEDDDVQSGNGIGQGAVAGPSSPSRRRRRPNTTRRRSSSISAAASLLSSYSATAPTDAEDDEDDEDGSGNDAANRRPRNRQRSASAGSGAFAPDAATIARDARHSFFHRKASPYHMALVTVLFSLASDMPLASQFKVYNFMMCKILQMRQGVPDGDFSGSIAGKALALVGLLSDQARQEALPPAPELPSSPVCDETWIQDASATYAAAMATVGALLSLLLLNRCSKISQRFGRKPLLLLTHFLLAVSTFTFRVSIFLPTLVGVTAVYIAVVILEASAGAPLRIAIQNYVVDTTTESQRAAALSFTDGFGQVGAFPSGTLGGWLAAITQNFFAPFYASIASYIVALVYILVFVPESKKRHHHTIIDDFEEWHAGSPDEVSASQGKDGKVDTANGKRTLPREPSEENYTETVTESYIDVWQRGRPSIRARIRTWLDRINFLSPLAVFWPRRRINVHEPNIKQKVDWRVFNLAIIVVLEESFQVFMLPMLLLYNTKVFGYDVVQNGYLVSLLQGVRALYLTVIFPTALGRIRSAFKRLRSWQMARNARLESLLAPVTARQNDVRQEVDERTPLMQEGRSDSRHQGETTAESRVADQAEQNKTHRREERGRLDIIVMFFSYILAGSSFALLSTTRAWSEDYERRIGHENGQSTSLFFSLFSPTSKLPPYIGVAVAIVGVQLGAGATSLRTALLVNAVSDQEDEREEAEAKWRAHLSQGNGASGSREGPLADEQRREQVSVQIHHERHQTKALAANQILCTAVYAVVPLVTSRIFGVGLVHGHPELVWLFKSAMAFVCSGATIVLLMSYGLAAQQQQDAQPQVATQAA